MFEFWMFRMDEFLRSFVQNLSSNVEMFHRKRREATEMICYVDRSRKLKDDNFRIKEAAKYVLLQHYLENSDMKSVQLFIERQTNFLDKFISPTNMPLMSSHLKSINKRIVQKLRKLGIQSVVNVQKRSGRVEKNLNHSIYGKSNCQSNMAQVDPAKRIVFNLKEQSKCLSSSDGDKNEATLTEKLKIERWNVALSAPCKKDYISGINLSSDTAEYTKEIELNQRYIELCIRGKDFLKRRISITLYIDVQELHKNTFEMNESNYDQVHILCKEAILCSIEPSKRGFVVFEENLLTAVKNHLLNGYTYHFKTPSRNVDRYSALLVLSHWAKVLVRHPNTIMMRTICSILNCDTSGIIVLCQSDGNLLDT